MKGVGGLSKTIGEARIPIPRRGLGIIIYVNLPNPQQLKYHTLLSIRDMIKNHLDRSLIKQHITHGIKTQKLDLGNYFLTHKWKPADQPYVFYKFSEL